MVQLLCDIPADSEVSYFVEIDFQIRLWVFAHSVEFHPLKSKYGPPVAASIAEPQNRITSTLLHFKCNNKWLLLRSKFEFSEWKRTT